MSSGGGSSGSAPRLEQLNTDKLASLAGTYQHRGFEESDLDFASRFPELASARTSQADDSVRQLKGGAPRSTTKALATAGLTPEGSSIFDGNEFSTSRNMGADVLAKEKRDRNYFENELQLNPPRDITGFSGADALRVAEANTGNLNALNQTRYQTQVQNYASGVANQAQLIGGLTTALAGGVKDYAKIASPSAYNDPYTNPFGTGGAYSYEYFGSPDYMGSNLAVGGGG